MCEISMRCVNCVCVCVCVCTLCVCDPLTMNKEGDIEKLNLSLSDPDMADQFPLMLTVLHWLREYNDSAC